jgi:hypothetical protein
VKSWQADVATRLSGVVLVIALGAHSANIGVSSAFRKRSSWAFIADAAALLNLVLAGQAEIWEHSHVLVIWVDG